MQTIIEAQRISQLLERMAQEIVQHAAGAPLALVGIRSRGEILAQRLQAILTERHHLNVDRGTLDITLYRDDLNQMGYQQPQVRATEIEFSIDNRLIILVDDVLNTGRSARAALDALIDLGRPQAIRLAVLIDRGQRELPISPDFTGQAVEAPKDKRVQVYLREADKREEVVIE